MSDILVKVGADISNFSRNISKATQDMSSMGKASNGLTFGKLLGAVGITAAVAKGFDMVKESVGRAFSRIDTMEQFERVMTTMTGSSKKAQSVLDDVNETVKGTAYGLDVGAKAVQSFVTSNMDVDKATMTFAAWGDAVAFYGDGTNETLGSVTDALAKATAKGKIQMDTMNRLAEAGIPAMQIYADATGQSVEDVANQMRKGQLKADEFINVMNDAMMNGTKSFESIKGAAKEAGASWSGSFDNMRAAVARGVIAIIQNIDEMLTSNGLPDMREMVAMFGAKFEEVLKKAADAIPKVVDKLKEVYNTIEPWLPLMGAVASAVVGMVAAWSAFNTVKTMIENVKGAFKALNLVMAANPWVLIIGAIIAAAVLVYVYWEPISEFFIKLWDKIKEAGITVWDWLKDVWQSTVEFFVSLWEGISEFFSNLWNGIVDVATSVWDSVVDTWNTVVDFIYNIFGPLIEFYSNLWTTIVSTASQIWSNFVTMLSGIWENVQTMASAAWEIIKNVVLGAILLLINLATGNMQGFRENLSEIWQNIKDAAGIIWQALKSNVVLIITTLVKNGLLIWQNFKNTLSNLLNSLKQTASNIWNSLKSAVVRIIANLVSSALQKWNNLKSQVINVIARLVSDAVAKWESLRSQTLSKMIAVKDTIINTLKNINLMQIGQQIIQGFINGIKSKVAGVAAAAKSAADAVTGKIKSILKIASPSRVLAQIGRWTGEGLAIGIEKTTGLVERATAKLAEAATPDAPAISLAYDTPSGIRSSLSSAVSGTVDVNARDDMIAAAIASLERKLDGLIVEMDGETVGRIVRPHVNDGNALDATVRRYFD